MNELQSFVFDEQPIRVVEIAGEPWFVGKDVAESLGYTNPNKAMNDHCKGVTKRYPLQTEGGIQDTRIISEPDMLRLIVGSRLPAAERFERWVFEDVLPSIRRTGRYDARQETSFDRNRWLIEAAERISGKDAAFALWHELGLPALKVGATPAPTPTPKRSDGLAGSYACLNHLLQFPIGNVPVRELMLRTLNNESAACYTLIQFGICPERNHAKTERGFRIWEGSRRMRRVFVGTLWDNMEWDDALLRLPGAEPMEAPPTNNARARARPVVFIPARLIETDGMDAR